MKKVMPTFLTKALKYEKLEKPKATKEVNYVLF